MKKKNSLVSLVLICVIFLGVVLVKNLSYEAYEVDYTELTEEEMLRKMPEAVANETDLAIQERLLALPEVQALAESEEPVIFPFDFAEEAVGDLLPENAQIMDLSGRQQHLYFSYQQGAVQVTMQFDLDGSQDIYKLACKWSRRLYESFPDGTFRKTSIKRDWLYFLKG